MKYLPATLLVLCNEVVSLLVVLYFMAMFVFKIFSAYVEREERDKYGM